MKHFDILLAGFGGQGILFAGKVLAYAGVVDGMQVSWLPSYGPEMRGGTANCHVIISENQVGCPIIASPNILVAMNRPSLEKFGESVQLGGHIFADSSMIDIRPEQEGVSSFYIPATKVAVDLTLPKLANMIMLGKLVKETNICSLETLYRALEKSIPASKVGMMESNRRAIESGYNAS